MAEGLIAIAAERELRRTDPLYPPAGVYDEFCARFPYTETDDQLKAIDEVLGDLAAGRPMDRSEEHTSELQSLMRSSYAVCCLKKKNRRATDIERSSNEQQ